MAKAAGSMSCARLMIVVKFAIMSRCHYESPRDCSRKDRECVAFSDTRCLVGSGTVLNRLQSVLNAAARLLF